MKKYVPILILIFASLFFYTATLRGEQGNFNTTNDIKRLYYDQGPFESSHEKSSYAQMIAIAQTHSVSFPQPWADFGASDVGFYKGKFYSFFPPGVSAVVVPLYLIGRHFNLGQLFSYATVPFFAILGLIFVFKIANEIFKMPRWASLFASLTFGFATTAWGYSVTIYQHIFAAFFIVIMFYAAWRYRQKQKKSWLWASLVWGMYGISIFFDYPNGIILFPIIVYLFASGFTFNQNDSISKIHLDKSFVLTSLIFITILGSFFYYNQVVFGNWKLLHNSLPGYEITNYKQLLLENEAIAEKKSDVAQIFKDRFFPKNFLIFLFSRNRGIFYYSPIFFLAILGLIALGKRMTIEIATLCAVVAVTLFLYCSFADSWGGYAYGSRYLIPIMPVLSIFVASWVNQTRYKFVATVLFLYSGAVALLGALISNMIPQGYRPVINNDFFLNVNLMKEGLSGSFVYNNFFIDDISLVHYFFVIYGFLLVTVIFVLFILPRYDNAED